MLTDIYFTHYTKHKNKHFTLREYDVWQCSSSHLRRGAKPFNKDSVGMTLTNFKGHFEGAHNMIKMDFMLLWTCLTTAHLPSALGGVFMALLAIRVLCRFPTSAELVISAHE